VGDAECPATAQRFDGNLAEKFFLQFLICARRQKIFLKEETQKIMQ